MKTILAIDIPENVRLILDAGTKNLIPDCKILTACSGEEGVAMAREKQPDTILLDMNRAGQKECAICKQLKAGKRTKLIPVMVLANAATTSEIRARSLANGADAFLKMPIDPIEFSAQIKLLFRVKEVEESLQEEKKILEKTILKRTHKLFESEKKLRLTIDNSPVGVSTTNLEGHFTNINQALCNMTGYSRKELIGQHFNKFSHPDDFAKNRELFEKLVAGEIEYFDIEKRYIHKNENIVNVQIRAQLVHDKKGNPLFQTAIIEDITKRKQAEEQLKEQEARIRSIFRSAPVGIGVAIGRTITRVNKKMCEITGFSTEELFNQNASILYPSRYECEKVAKITTEQVNRFGNGTVETQWKRKDGKIIDIVLSSSPIDLNDLSKGVTFTALDITDRNRAEKMIRESEKRYRTLFETANDAILLLQNETIVSCNLRALEMFACNKSDILGHSPLDVSPEFQPNGIRTEDLAYVKMKKAISGKPQIFDWIHERKDGTPFFAEVSLNKITLSDGDYIQAIVRDVTEQKQTEEALRVSEKKFREMANMLPQVVYEADILGNLTFVNEQAYDVFGYSRTEFNNTINVVQLVIPEERERAKNSIQDILKGSSLVNNEYTARRKDGTVFPILVYSNVILEESKIIGFRGLIVDITERKKTENEILKLSSALQQSPSVVAIANPKGDLEYVNPRFSELTGYSSEEVIGKNPRILKSGEHPPQFYLDFWKSITSGEKWRGEFRNRKKNGELFWEAASVSPVFDDKGKITSFLKVAEDITEKKRSEQIQKVLYNISNAVITTGNLEKLIGRIKEELETIIDTTNFFVALYDRESDSLSLPFFADKRDKYPPVPAGKTLTKYVIDTKKPLLANIDTKNRLIREGKLEHVGTLSKVWLGVPLKYEEEITGVLAVQSYTDKHAFDTSDMELLEFVSEQISISIHRKKAEDDLVNALKKATESDRIKSSFLATMSHELRTPLNAIIGFSDLINKNLPIESIINFTKTINSSGNHLLSIIDDLFDIALIESHEIKIVKERVYLQTILDNVQEIITVEQNNSNKQHIELSLVVPGGDKELIVETDPAKLKQILINLLKNALKFTQKGEIKFGYNVEVVKGKSLLKFFVEDQGIGIPKEKQKFIFEMFRQIEDSHTRTYGGAGIGLSISKNLTGLLGGEMWVESEEGKGSCFYFTLPLDQPENTGKQATASERTKEDFHEKTVLIVEDDMLSYEYLKIILKKLQVNSVWAKDGEESIEMCKTTVFDLILMDINLPVINGYEATKEIKKICPEIPIIAQTAYAIAGDYQKIVAAGCDDYVSKPIKKEILLSKIEKWLGK